LIVKSERKRPLEKHSRRWEYNIKNILNKNGGRM
jgi:hypothetical protein